ncbi:MAG: hypothetical protein MI746_17695 [Pseudomonadales bacterium]|nr:hypothetical protein [Pseudomonadales bacterium]
MINSEAVAYETSTIEREIDSFFDSSQQASSLQMDERIKVLANGLKRLIKFDSFEFESPQEGVHLSLGQQAPHRCHYRITDDGVESGQFTLTRKTPFNEKELVLVESAMAGLVSESHL